MVLTYGILPKFCGCVDSFMSRSTIGGAGGTSIPSPEWSPKQPLPGIGLHDPLHGRQACLELNSFHQEIGQICPREGLFLRHPLPNRGDSNLRHPRPPQSLNDSHLNRRTPSGQSRVYRITQLRTDGVHCRESAGTGPLNLKIVPSGCCLSRSPWTN